MKLDKSKHIYLVGIGGVGISWIAEMLLSDGYSVSGSDINTNNITAHLQSLGATIYSTHDAKWIENADILIHTAAVGKDHVEIDAAIKKGIPIYNRSQMQGKLIETYSTSLAVSGSHGKSTTTSMIATILQLSDKYPTLLIGAHLDALGGNAHIGKDDILVMEACEYKDSFLNFKPTSGIILNVDEDHLDYFKDFNHILSSFKKFANGVSKEGAVFINLDDKALCKFDNQLNTKTISIGIHKKADYTAQNIHFNDLGHPEFDVFHKGNHLCKCTLSVYGIHNVYNSLFAIAFCHHIGIDMETITKALSAFKNPSRRFEHIGYFLNTKVIDDYAHHPKEIMATLSSARQITKGKIVCVFQPHTYTRTFTLLDEFSTSFYDADKVLLIDIYAAREPDENIVNSKMLSDKILENEKDSTYIPSYDELKKHLKEILSEDDLLIMMGAGDISELAHKLVDEEL